MFKIKTVAAAAAIAAIVAVAPVQAQFVGGPSHLTTVKALADSGKDDQIVTLEGFITQQVKQRWYTQDLNRLEFVSDMLDGREPK